MDLPRGLLARIDDYVSDALDATGTRKLRQARRALTPPPIGSEIEVDIDVSDMEPPGEDELIPVEVDDRTDPEALNIFSYDEGTAWMAPAFQAPRDPIPMLSRVRTARGSCPPPAEIEVDEEEITNLVGMPTSSKP
jgi:hypothetical protein